MSAIVFSPDENLLAAGMYSYQDAGVRHKGYAANVCRTVELFAVDGSEPGVVVARETWFGNQGPLARTTPALAFLDRGRQLAILLNEDRLDVWDTNARKRIRSDSADFDHVTGFAYSPDEKMVALIPGFGVSIRKLPGLTELHWSDLGGAVFWQAPQVMFSPDGRFFTSTTFSPKLVVWDTNTWTPRHEFPSQEDEVFQSIDFSADSQRLGLASSKGIRILNIETDEVRAIPGPAASERGYFRQITFLPDNTTIASVGNQGASFIDVNSGEVLRQIASLPSHRIKCAAISPRGNLLATGDASGSVTLWDVATGTKLRTFKIGYKYSLPWPVPAAFLLIWMMLYRMVTKHRLFTWKS